MTEHNENIKQIPLLCRAGCHFQESCFSQGFQHCPMQRKSSLVIPLLFSFSFHIILLFIILSLPLYSARYRPASHSGYTVHLAAGEIKSEDFASMNTASFDRTPDKKPDTDNASISAVKRETNKSAPAPDKDRSSGGMDTRRAPQQQVESKISIAEKESPKYQKQKARDLSESVESAQKEPAETLGEADNESFHSVPIPDELISKPITAIPPSLSDDSNNRSEDSPGAGKKEEAIKPANEGVALQPAIASEERTTVQNTPFPQISPSSRPVAMARSTKKNDESKGEALSHPVTVSAQKKSNIIKSPQAKQREDLVIQPARTQPDKQQNSLAESRASDNLERESDERDFMIRDMARSLSDILSAGLPETEEKQQSLSSSSLLPQVSRPAVIELSSDIPDKQARKQMLTETKRYENQEQPVMAFSYETEKSNLLKRDSPSHILFEQEIESSKYIFHLEGLRGNMMGKDIFINSKTEVSHQKRSSIHQEAAIRPVLSEVLQDDKKESLKSETKSTDSIRRITALSTASFQLPSGSQSLYGEKSTITKEKDLSEAIRTAIMKKASHALEDREMNAAALLPDKSVAQVFDQGKKVAGDDIPSEKNPTLLSSLLFPPDELSSAPFNTNLLSDSDDRIHPRDNPGASDSVPHHQHSSPVITKLNSKKDPLPRGIAGADSLLAKDIKIEIISDREDIDQFPMPLFIQDYPSSKKSSRRNKKRIDLSDESLIFIKPEGTSVKRILSLTTAQKGTYVFVIENHGEIPLTVDVLFRLYEGKKTERNKKYESKKIGPGSLLSLRFLLPDSVFWDDEEYFSGRVEDSHSITKFNDETGLVWREEKEY